MSFGCEDLAVWKRARILVKDVYLLTLPDHEKFGLSSQIRRAAVSIPANLAEGYGRQQQMDRRRFVEIAMGSAAELGCLLLLVEDLGLADPGPTQKVKQEANEIHKMLRGLWFSFKKE